MINLFVVCMNDRECVEYLLRIAGLLLDGLVNVVCWLALFLFRSLQQIKDSKSFADAAVGVWKLDYDTEQPRNMVRSTYRT